MNILFMKRYILIFLICLVVLSLVFMFSQVNTFVLREVTIKDQCSINAHSDSDAIKVVLRVTQYGKVMVSLYPEGSEGDIDQAQIITLTEISKDNIYRFTYQNKEYVTEPKILEDVCYIDKVDKTEQRASIQEEIVHIEGRCTTASANVPGDPSANKCSCYIDKNINDVRVLTHPTYINEIIPYVQTGRVYGTCPDPKSWDIIIQTTISETEEPTSQITIPTTSPSGPKTCEDLNKKEYINPYENWYNACRQSLLNCEVKSKKGFLGSPLDICVAKCTDTDLNDDPLEKGIVTFGSETKQDECIDGNNVNEVNCESHGVGFASTRRDCPNGYICPEREGACIKKTEIEKVELKLDSSGYNYYHVLRNHRIDAEKYAETTKINNKDYLVITEESGFSDERQSGGLVCSALVNNPEKKEIAVNIKLYSRSKIEDLFVLRTLKTNLPCEYYPYAGSDSYRCILKISKNELVRGEQIMCGAEIVQKDSGELITVSLADRYDEAEKDSIKQLSKEDIVIAQYKYIMMTVTDKTEHGRSIISNGALTSAKNWLNFFYSLSEVNKNIKLGAKEVYLKENIEITRNDITNKVGEPNDIADFIANLVEKNYYFSLSREKDAIIAIVPSPTMLWISEKNNIDNAFVVRDKTVDNKIEYKPVIFIKYGTQDKTLAHEFGHYYAKLCDEYDPITWGLQNLQLAQFGDGCPNPQGDDGMVRFPICCYAEYKCCLKDNKFEWKLPNECRKINGEMLSINEQEEKCGEPPNGNIAIQFSVENRCLNLPYPECYGMPYSDTSGEHSFDINFVRENAVAFSIMGKHPNGPYVYPQIAKCPLRNCEDMP